MRGVLACIGNSFEDEEEVCGIVVSLRKQYDKISLWTKTASSAEKTKRIGQQLKELLEIPQSTKIEYTLHSAHYNSSAKYEV